MDAGTAREPFDGRALRAQCTDQSKRKRSAVTNGKAAFVSGLGDGNSSWYKRFKDIVELHASDMGGKDYLSEAQKSLIRRASTMEVELERQEGQLSLGQDVDLDSYSRIAQRLHSILAGLGLKRVPRTVDGSSALTEYFSSPAAKTP